jgi:glutathione S-transferase
MRLYQHLMSSSARRVLLTAAHIGCELELVDVNLMNEEDRRRLCELNPNSKIPVLDDDGFVLWESIAIMQYLCGKQGGHPAYPGGLRERADVDRWLFWSAQHWSPAFSVLVWENHWKGIVGAGEPDASAVARGNAEFAQYARVLDAHLAGRTWVSGTDVTIADFALAASLMYAEKARLPLADYPNVQKWFAAVQQLPCWGKTHIDL